ncbi:anthranilate synthase component I family protein [Pedobacter sp. PWIIR3]
MKIPDLDLFKRKALKWADRFDVCCYLDSNQYSDPYGKYDFLIAAGIKRELKASIGGAFDAWKAFVDENATWMFGMLSYDLKNEIEQLHSGKPDRLGFPDLYFFVPEYLIGGRGDEMSVIIGETALLTSINEIELREGVSEGQSPNGSIEIRPKITKQTYLSSVKELQQHILRGDVYETNFCQEFFAEHAQIEPVEVYLRLSELSPTPFSGYFKWYKKYILSASPERFLCKRGNRLISQPIKGTAKRSTDEVEDNQNRLALKHDIKEQSENVMIVDLVRNDLTKSAVKGSVVVNELFGIYAFPQVYQMISTISCELDQGIHFIDAIKNAFPMGSMTGAPKLRAMQLIEDAEFSKRGMYSGAMGYIDPARDFDFNVIIRSLLYDTEAHYLSFQVGGAITYAANAEAEYEECLLKASAMIRTLEQ